MAYFAIFFRLPESFHIMKKIFLLINVLILSACGFKGDLYLPKENDKNQFGIIQTGLETQSTQPQTETKP